MMEPVILLISTLDTKGPETLFLRDAIRGKGGVPIVLDMSMSGESIGADITPARVAEAAGVHTLLQGALRRTENEDQLLAETEMTFDLLYEAYFEPAGKAG